MYSKQATALQSSKGGASDARDDVLRLMPPLADQIVEKAIDNMTRKLVAGYRNKKRRSPTRSIRTISQKQKKRWPPSLPKASWLSPIAASRGRR